MRLCGRETWDGNIDDPTPWYCGLPLAHAGQCGEWVQK
jgi:hypothetical protein